MLPREKLGLLLPGQDPTEDSPRSIPRLRQFFRFNSITRTYGRLDISPDPGTFRVPCTAFSYRSAFWPISAVPSCIPLELSAFIEGQCQRLDYQNPQRLTKTRTESPGAYLSRIRPGVNRYHVIYFASHRRNPSQTHLREIRCALRT